MSSINTLYFRQFYPSVLVTQMKDTREAREMVKLNEALIRIELLQGVSDDFQQLMRSLIKQERDRVLRSDEFLYVKIVVKAHEIAQEVKCLLEKRGYTVTVDIDTFMLTTTITEKHLYEINMRLLVYYDMCLSRG